MSHFIHHTLTLLIDAGMRVDYPTFRNIMLDENGLGCDKSGPIPLRTGLRVNIQQNPQLEFLMLFSMLDFYIDSKHPELEGNSFSQKCRKLPKECDLEIILMQLYRTAKIIRNALIHNQSAASFSSCYLAIDYTHNNRNFSLNISRSAYDDFRTAIVMYLRQDMGGGNYFQGIIRSVYDDMLAGVIDYNDEFGSKLEHCTSGLRLNRRLRERILNPHYEKASGILRFSIPNRGMTGYAAIDLLVIIDGAEYIVPHEALDKNQCITEAEIISNWKR